MNENRQTPQEQKRINTVIAILTEQRNTALNQVVALQVELSEAKDQLATIRKEEMQRVMAPVAPVEEGDSD